MGPFLRDRLWLKFHLGTVGLIVLLAIANVASALRTYSPQRSGTSTASLILSPASLVTSDRSPASQGEGVPTNPRLALKIASVGCEAKLSLKVVVDVRQLRLQFEACAADDTIAGIQNRTNGFEATLFGTATADTTASEAVSGVFTTPDAAAEKSRTIATENVSTDYIALAPGSNEIVIRRANREQILRIERK